jgi:hypothetical protein
LSKLHDLASVHETCSPLLDVLSVGPILANEVQRQAKEAAISAHTLSLNYRFDRALAVWCLTVQQAETPAVLLAGDTTILNAPIRRCVHFFVSLPLGFKRTERDLLDHLVSADE